MARFSNQYYCQDCVYGWTMEWDCMCDDRCPRCNTSLTPVMSDELDDEAEIEEETEEEHAVRLQRISDEIKADMKAGRYRHGQLHPEISAKNQPKEVVIDSLSILRDMTMMEMAMFGKSMVRHGTLSGRYTNKRPAFHELYGSRADMVIMDECHHIRPHEMWLTDYPEKTGQEKDGPKKPYWTQPIPEKGEETPPSDAKRAKLRKKRKKRK